MSEILVFRYDIVSGSLRVLVPIEVPKGITIDNVGEWLTTLIHSEGIRYKVIVTSDVKEYVTRKHPQVFYIEEVGRGGQRLECIEGGSDE